MIRILCFRRLWISLAICCWANICWCGEKFEEEFFGVHVLRSIQNRPWAEVGFGSIRLHDANVTWLDLEPKRDIWNWERLDRIVIASRAAGAKILLPLQATPEWASSKPENNGSYGHGANAMPTDIRLWENYVRKVVGRYKGKIEAYEVWNEPNLKNFFDGTPGEMELLTRRAASIIREVDPSAKLVCASITGSYGIAWLKAYLATGIGRQCDVIGYHLYTHHQSPESILPIIKSIRQVMSDMGVGNKPLWNTESGWLAALDGPIDPTSSGFRSDARVLTEAEVSAYVPRALLLARSAGVDRFYWYAWDHLTMGLSRGRGTEWGRPGRVYASFVRLVGGASLESCGKFSGTWQCVLTSVNGQSIWVAWSEQGATSVSVPSTGVLRRMNSAGYLQDVGRVNSGDSIGLHEEPIYLNVAR